jgi:hypothetical protein
MSFNPRTLSPGIETLPADQEFFSVSSNIKIFPELCRCRKCSTQTLVSLIHLYYVVFSRRFDCNCLTACPLSPCLVPFSVLLSTYMYISCACSPRSVLRPSGTLLAARSPRPDPTVIAAHVGAALTPHFRSQPRKTTPPTETAKFALYLDLFNNRPTPATGRTQEWAHAARPLTFLNDADGLISSPLRPPLFAAEVGGLYPRFDDPRLGSCAQAMAAVVEKRDSTVRQQLWAYEQALATLSTAQLVTKVESLNFRSL